MEAQMIRLPKRVLFRMAVAAATLIGIVSF